ncbi:MAG: PorP/SprF family type IX secretion system membrane protein [Bacteroidales bacterium]|nr:PorP/SprF family type IX secretion system membrane protein [Bacteroidales bacterium]
MKKRLTQTILMIGFLLIAGSVNAQQGDVGFSQFYANPLYYNPAFAGSKVAPRFSLTYRCQWPSLVSAYSTVSASYDQYIPKLHGGIGAIILTDRQGDHGMLSTSQLGVMYSFRFQVGKEVFINAALEASVANYSLNWDPNTMRFPDQIDPSNGFVNLTSAQMPDETSKWLADFSAGVLAYGHAWYAGAAVSHFTQPNQAFYGEDLLPMKVTFNAGGLINLSEERRRTSTLGLGTPVLSPNFIYQYQGSFHYFNYGLYLDWMPFLVGVWYRNGLENSDALIFMLGVQQDYFKVGYSYDITVSELANNTAGAHEVTLGVLLPIPEAKKKIKAVRCPSF